MFECQYLNDSRTYARFQLINDDFVIKRATQAYDYIIYPVCDDGGSFLKAFYNRDVKVVGVEFLSPGIMELRGDKWVVVEKAKLRAIYNDEKKNQENQEREESDMSLASSVRNREEPQKTDGTPDDAQAEIVEQPKKGVEQGADEENNDLEKDGSKSIENENNLKIYREILNGDFSRVSFLTKLTEEIARALAEHNNWLYLNKITELTPETARALAEHKGTLFLNGITELTPETARALAEYKDQLYLTVKELSLETARALAEYKGKILSLHVKKEIERRIFNMLKTKKNIYLQAKKRPFFKGIFNK